MADTKVNILGVNEIDFPNNIIESASIAQGVVTLNAAPNFQVVTKTANYTAVAGDIILCNTSGGGFTITLPLAAANSTSGVQVKKTSSDTNTLTIAASGSDTIDGDTTKLITVPQTEVEFMSNGVSTWEVGLIPTGKTGVVSGGGGSGPVLETDGVLNGDQSLLNLKAGTNVTLTDDGVGGVTIDATGGGGSGTVTNTGTLDAHQVVIGNSGVDVKVVAGTGTAGQYLRSGGASADPAMATPTPAEVGLGNVTNDAQTKAAVVPNTAPSSGQILVGNAGGTAYAPKSVGGDATLNDAGALTLGNSGVTAGSYTNSNITVDAKGRVTAASSGAAVYDVSAGSLVAVTSVIVAAYRDYEIRISDVVFSTAGAQLLMQFSTNNGSTWDTASSYVRDGVYNNVDGTNAGPGNLGVATSTSWPVLLLGQGTSAGQAGSTRLTLFNPLSTNTHKRMCGNMIQFQNSDSREYVMLVGFKYTNVNAVNAFKFFPSTGTFSGRITVQPLP